MKGRIMNTKIKSIKDFLDEYKNKTEYLQILLEDTYEYYYKELMNEYIRTSKQPFRLELINMDKDLNTYEKHINRILDPL